MKSKQKKSSGSRNVQAAPIRHHTNKDVPALEDMGMDDNAPMPSSAVDDTATRKCNKKRVPGSPEVIGDVNDAPIPLSSDNQVHFESKKQTKKVKVKRTNQRVAPVTDTPVVDRTQDSRYLGLHLSINNGNENEQQVEQSHHSENNEVSIAEEGLAIAHPVKAYLAEDETIYEASELDPSMKTSFYKSQRCCAITTIVLIAATAIISLSTMYAPRKRGGDDKIVYYFNKTSYLASLGIEESVKNESDPRYLALEWILHTDKMTATGSNVLQRYTLALLAFSFDIYSWECGMVKELELCNMTVDADDYALWLTNTHECSWYGVSCNNIGSVTELDLSE